MPETRSDTADDEVPHGQIARFVLPEHVKLGGRCPETGCEARLEQDLPRNRGRMEGMLGS